MINDRITDDIERRSVRVSLIDVETIRALRHRMPDLAAQSGKISQNLYTRALIVRGLTVLGSKKFFENMAWVIPNHRTSNSLTIPVWVDAWIYELADQEGRSMSEIAQTALELGRAQVLSSS